MQAERRFYKRYPVSFKFQLIVNDRTYTNEALNLSSDGIQIGLQSSYFCRNEDLSVLRGPNSCFKIVILVGD